MPGYEWWKVTHIIAIIAWMAGLLYLPRLFVYHSNAKPGSELSETFKIMERRLLKAIMTPAMILAWIAGLVLAIKIDAFETGWFHGKLLLVVALTISHFIMAGHVKRFARDENRHSGRFFRIFNEIPTLIMVGVVILVIVKPF